MQPDPADVGAPDAPEVPAGAGPAVAGYCWEAYRDGVRDGLERGKLGLSALLAETMEAQKGFPENREQNRNTVRRGVLLDLLADKVRPAMARRDFEVETANTVGASSEPARMPWIRVFDKKLAPRVADPRWFLLILFTEREVVLTINRGVTEPAHNGKFCPSSPKQLKECAEEARRHLGLTREEKPPRGRFDISDHLDAGSQATAFAAANVVGFVHHHEPFHDNPGRSADRFEEDLDKLALYLAKLNVAVRNGHKFKVEP